MHNKALRSSEFNFKENNNKKKPRRALGLGTSLKTTKVFYASLVLCASPPKLKRCSKPQKATASTLQKKLTHLASTVP